PPFWFGAGGPIGSGRQYWPWIHRQDWIDLVRFTISNPQIVGPMNATAPNPVTNRDFARALGHAMHRPAFMPAPGFALKLLLGEMGRTPAFWTAGGSRESAAARIQVRIRNVGPRAGESVSVIKGRTGHNNR